jgi:hypothetical protein
VKFQNLLNSGALNRSILSTGLYALHPQNPFNFADIIYKLWVEKSGAAVPAVG